MRKISIFISILLIATLAILCAKKEEAAEEIESVPVTVVQPQTGDIVVYYNTSSTIEASDVREIAFPVAGEVIETYKDEGEQIIKGDLLARLDTQSYQDGLKAAESNLALAQKRHNAAKVERDIYANRLTDAENTLAEDKKDLHRFERLHDDNAATDKELEEKQKHYESSLLAVENARKALQLAEGQILTSKDSVDAATAQRNIVNKQLHDAVLVAPFEGTISKKFIETGAIVAPGVPVFEVVAQGAQKIVASLPDRYLTSVSEGGNVLLTIPNNDCILIPQ